MAMDRRLGRGHLRGDPRLAAPPRVSRRRRGARAEGRARGLRRVRAEGALPPLAVRLVMLAGPGRDRQVPLRSTATDTLWAIASRRDPVRGSPPAAVCL